MAATDYLIAYETGEWLPPRYGETRGQYRGEGSAHAVLARFPADGPPEVIALCGTDVEFLTRDSWPPKGASWCKECTGLVV